MIKIIIGVTALILVAAYLYSRYDTKASQYDWLYKKHDDDDDKPHKCPNCGW
jgi:hypothetical protein